MLIMKNLSRRSFLEKFGIGGTAIAVTLSPLSHGKCSFQAVQFQVAPAHIALILTGFMHQLMKVFLSLAQVLAMVHLKGEQVMAN